jgi:hypothetical protein
MPCGNYKSITHPSFGEVVLGFLQEGLSNIESEGKHTLGNDHSTEYADA